jgi:uncharacterized protein with PQ loop repeat
MMSTTPEIMLAIAGVLQGSLAVVTIAAVLPQWLKLYRTRTSQDISVLSWLIWTLASLVSLFYATCQVCFLSVGHSLLIATATSVVTNVVTLVIILAFRSSTQEKVESRTPDLETKRVHFVHLLEEQLDRSFATDGMVLPTRVSETVPVYYH